MKLNWNPTPKLIEKMKLIHEQKLKGKTYDQLAETFKLDRTMVIMYNKYFEAHFT